jgi:hypothetical protein
MRETRRKLGSLLILSACILALGSCGTADDGAQGNGSETTAAVADRALPAEGPVARGRYGSEEFSSPLSFGVREDGWQVVLTEREGGFAIGQGASSVGFLDVARVFDRDAPGEAIQRPAPDDLIAWVEGHPYLETSRPMQTSVGGVRGRRIDATAAKLPKEFPRICSGPCVPLFNFGGPDDDYWLGLDEKVRIIVLDDVGGRRVTVLLAASPEGFEAFLPRAQEVLDTVEWEA